MLWVMSQLVPKDLIGETAGQAVLVEYRDASQLVPKDLIGETITRLVLFLIGHVSIGPEGPHW